ncbi:hypothetical protein B7463_g12733, partial [Scytalidium lignicola]
MRGESVCEVGDVEDGLSVDIEQIQALGIGAADITKLKAANIYTVQELLGTHSKRLLKIKGFSEMKVEKLKEAGKKLQPLGSGFITASELGHLRKRCYRISTGSKQLDACLNGVWKDTASAYHGCYGPASQGLFINTNTRAISDAQQEMGGAEGKVAYIDTEGTFRPERIAEIAERFGVDPDQACENIVYARAQNSEARPVYFLQTLTANFSTNEYRLLIIDSVMALFRTDYIGRGELSDRQALLNQFLRKATSLAEEFNIAVLMTNQVMSDPGASALFAGADGRKPAGGHILAHASTTRLLLRKGRGEERVAKIVDSPG